MSTVLVCADEDTDESTLTAAAFIIENAKCFLCNRNFVEGEGTFLIFESRLRDDGGIDNPLSVILSTALGKELDESSTHSALLCESCNGNVLEFEKLLQTFCEMRIRIITAYNRTVQSYNIDPIVVDFDDEINHCSKVKQVSDNIITDDKIYESKDLRPVTKEKYKDNHSGHIQLQIIDEGDVTLNVPVEDLVEEISEHEDDGGEYILNVGIQKGNNYECLTEKCIDINAEASTLIFAVGEENFVEKPETDQNLQLKKFEMIFQQQGNLYVCLMCDEKSPMFAEKFAEHMSRDHALEFYTCEVCSAGFFSIENVKEHIEQMHITTQESEKNQCKICKQIFVNNELLNLHKRMHNSENDPFECFECNKKCNCRDLSLHHMNTHTGKRPYECNKCCKDFTSKYALQVHMKIHSEKQRLYKCDKCNKAFLNQQNFAYHKKIHVGEKAFICHICSKCFVSRHNLDVHKIVHSGQRPFICRACGKTFARRAEIKDHERIHTGEKPYKCDMCDAAFAQRSNLMTHRKSTHLNEKLHKCEQCERSFKRRRLLQYHINAVHTGVRPHECEVCGASFVYPEHKKKHMLIHGNSKPYPCEVCGKEFNSCANRNAHRFVHSSKKPYECVKCGAGFMRKPLLLTHMNQAGHTNDKIIINQPHINDNGTLSLVKEMDMVDSTDETMDFTSHSLKAVNTSTCNEAKQIISDNTNSIICDVAEIDSEQYLQLNDLDKDGHQIITWIDIESSKDGTEYV